MANGLENKLLSKSTINTNMVDINMKGNILKLFQEVMYWQRLIFDCPHYLVALVKKQEDLRILRENMLLIVRDYNRLVDNNCPV